MTDSREVEYGKLRAILDAARNEGAALKARLHHLKNELRAIKKILRA
jgi:hypothetical protein